MKKMNIIRVNPIFGDHMVIQRDAKVPIWGTGANGERVTVSCRGNQVDTVVQDGKWTVELSPMKAGGPEEIVIKSLAQSFVLNDILIGDVWLAGGQSNMEFVLKDSKGSEAEIATAHMPTVRFYNVPKVAYEDGKEHHSSWQICSSATAGQLSAVAYYYAKQVIASQHIPIGIISCNWGGTSATCWMSKRDLLDDSELSIYVDEYEQLLDTFDPQAYDDESRSYNQQVIDYSRREARGLQGEELGAYPWPPPLGPKSFLRPYGLYETMLRKVVPYAIKGALFYQGETDANRPVLYERLLSRMIENWRNDWDNQALPFLFVQLPTYSNDGRPDGEDWALLRESQWLVSERVPHTGMAVILDCGEYDDIHPKDKKPVGERLALVGLDRVYGVDVESSGPVFKELNIEQGKIMVNFSHIGEGLAARDIELRGFEIGDEQGNYVTASATIRGNEVEVRSHLIPQPTKVRYGWANYTDANLINSHGLPAGSFRSDWKDRR
jgi:sialate O-acetylesterase